MPSYTKAGLFILLASYHFAIGAPIPEDTDQVNNAYTGTGGVASGGSVNVVNNNSNGPNGNSNNSLGNLGLLNCSLLKLFSGNAGKAGHANSGSASSPTNSLDVGLNGTKTDADGTSISTSNTVGNSYSGTGGTTNGGDANDVCGALELFSNNAGAGGDGSSGMAGPPSLLGKKVVTSVGKTRVSRVIRLRLD